MAAPYICPFCVCVCVCVIGTGGRERKKLHGVCVCMLSAKLGMAGITSPRQYSRATPARARGTGPPSLFSLYGSVGAWNFCGYVYIGILFMLVCSYI